MQLSSLIFLVIVAIWAAYLIQHWVRRREHVATVRSVDRFSEAMRVLERRTPLPELSTPHPHSYAVKPAASRPAVVVKRASSVSAAAARDLQVTATVDQPGPRRSPLAARSSADAAAVRRTTMSVGTVTSTTTTTASPRTFEARRPEPSRRAMLLGKVRGVAVLVTLGAIPVTVGLSATGFLLWVSVPIAVAGCVAVVGWLRISVIRAQSARRVSTPRRAAGRPPASRVESVRSGATTVEFEDGALEDGVFEDADQGLATQPSARERAAAAVFDVNAPLTPARSAPPVAGPTLAAVQRQVSAQQQIIAATGRGGDWSPVPVPPPTYTLKDAAPRAMPEPAEVSQRPVPIEVEDDEIERMLAAHHRRVVGG